MREQLSAKLRKYVQQFGNSLTTDGNLLYCKACDKVITNPYKKFMVTQHLTTISHLKAIQVFQCKQECNEESDLKNLINQSLIDVNVSRSETRLHSYVQEFGNSLETDGNIINCKACQKQINNPFKKFIVKQHLTSKSHLKAIEVFNCHQEFDKESDDENENLFDGNERSEARIHKYVQEFSDVLTYVENALFCKACNKQIKNPYKKSIIRQHLANKSHVRAVQRQQQTGECSQQHFNSHSKQQNMCHQNLIQLNGYEKVEQIKTQNKLIRSDLDSESSLISILESIKDKVKLIINQCKCDFDSNVKNQIKVLVEDYDRRKNEFILNKSNDKNKEKIKTRVNSINRKKKLIIEELKSTKKVNINSQTIDKKNKINPKGRDESREDEYLLKEEKWCLGKRYVCPWPGCDNIYNLSSRLRTHLCVHTGNKRFKCHYTNCDKTYERRSTLAYHLEKHKYKGYKYAKTIPCDWSDCEKKFAFRFQLNHHKRVFHLKVIRFKCDWPQCESGFVTKQQYDSHVGECHIGRHLYACQWPKCDKRFKSKFTQQTHYNNIHLKQKKYKCEFDNCLLSFNGKEDLKSHIVQTHDGLKPHSCDWPGCGFNSLYSKALRSHKMRHTGERPYKCSWPQCVWTFRQSDHLKTHMLKHTGERPVVCDDPNCQSRFQSRHAMKVHFDRTHRIQVIQ